jgi:hypothetical protein
LVDSARLAYEAGSYLIGTWEGAATAFLIWQVPGRELPRLLLLLPWSNGAHATRDRRARRARGGAHGQAVRRDDTMRGWVAYLGGISARRRSHLGEVGSASRRGGERISARWGAHLGEVGSASRRGGERISARRTHDDGGHFPHRYRPSYAVPTPERAVAALPPAAFCLCLLPAAAAPFLPRPLAHLMDASARPDLADIFHGALPWPDGLVRTSPRPLRPLRPLLSRSARWTDHGGHFSP